jgi:tRNA dimethylallyltransferase
MVGLSLERSRAPDRGSAARASPVVPVLVGPTASGKTETALRLAAALGAEIISADSRQIYRFMDIGTAKPTPAERWRVPHHFIDERDPDETFSAGEFGSQARERVGQILGRGNVPLVVGGSGLYLRSLIDGLFEGPGAHPRLRGLLEERVRAGGISELLEELRSVDAEAARGASAATPRRIIRALEVYHATGVPLTTHQRQSRPLIAFRPMLVGLAWDRPELHGRIEARCEAMISAGLLKEIESLEAMGYDSSCNALNTVGYVEMSAYRRGQITWQEARERFMRNTRRYAKRQMTWFRADRRILWLPMSGSFGPDSAAKLIAATYAEAVNTNR